MTHHTTGMSWKPGGSKGDSLSSTVLTGAWCQVTSAAANNMLACSNSMSPNKDFCLQALLNRPSKLVGSSLGLNYWLRDLFSAISNSSFMTLAIKLQFDN